jgi:hypothetical protein
MQKKTQGKFIKLTKAIRHAKIREAEERMDKELAKPSKPQHFIEVEMRNPC